MNNLDKHPGFHSLLRELPLEQPSSDLNRKIMAKVHAKVKKKHLLYRFALSIAISIGIVLVLALPLLIFKVFGIDFHFTLSLPSLKTSGLTSMICIIGFTLFSLGTYIQSRFKKDY